MTDAEVLEKLWEKGFSGSEAQNVLNCWHLVQGIRGENDPTWSVK